MIRLYTLLYLLFFAFNSFGQNELYNNAGIVYVNDRISTSIATLRVNGSITNNNGSITNNNGLIEVAGNWTNTSTSNNYISTGIERFVDTFNQTIDGVWNGAGANNQFYDLKINKTQSRGQYVNLNVDTKIKSGGSLQFESNFGIIRTDVLSHTDDGSLYPYELFLQNTTPSSLSGYSWTSVALFGKTGGATTKYIEGKFRRAVVSAGTNSYDFPIGVTPSSLDGMEGVTVAFTSAFAAANVLSYIQHVPIARIAYPNDLITNGQAMFFDIGSLPATSPANQFQNCVGIPDGHLDVALIDATNANEWIFTASATTSNYNLSIHPGPNLDTITYVQMGVPCSSSYPKTKYLANNGRIGGDEAVGPTNVFDIPGVLGLYQKPNGNTLTGQSPLTTTSSRIRIFGSNNPSNTSLPVELTTIQADAINNEYIKVSWTTASELNNKGFVLLRSIDNYSFDSIGWITGNGTTASPHNYYFDDKNVEKGIIYYYKLKQVDYSNLYTFSRTVAAKLVSSYLNNVIVFPNPSNTNTSVQIVSPRDDEYSLDTYDVIGQLMYAANVNVKSNTITKIELPSNDWAKGVYFIKIRTLSKNNTECIRFLKD